jgi:hypothetical protein
MLVTLGMSVLAALTLGRMAGDVGRQPPLMSQQTSIGLCIVLAVASFFGSVMWTLERRRAGARFAWLIACLSLVVLLGSSPRLGSLTNVSEQMRLLSDVSSAVLLGGAMTSMLLGHWYLTAPMMSIEPLKRLTWYFGGSGLLRLLVSGVGLALAWGMIGNDTHRLWLALRWAAGVIGPLVVFVMVWRILKYKNTQAATGVLFVGVILTFIGEMTGSLLYLELSAAF